MEWPDMENVEGRVAFVTGGASGIGLGMVKAFLRAGMNVAIVDVRQDHLDEAKHELNAGNRVRTLKLDVTDRAAFARVADEVEHAFGKIHVLCNNAGIGLAGPAKFATYEDWDWVLGVDLGGVVNGVVTVLPRILKHGEGGHIVNTASMSGVMPNPNTIQYTVAKAGVIAMSEVLRTELGPDNVGVTAFCPGPVQTNIGKSGETRPAHLANTGYAEFDRRRAANSNAHLWMDPVEVGELVLDGVRKNKLYVFTHSEFGPGIQERCDALMAAVPDKPRNPEFEAAVPFLLKNPIFANKGKG
jgi:NAD(P)-dependent dehydrogenase (short-subunit alcohol dehydrogenase family)